VCWDCRVSRDVEQKAGLLEVVADVAQLNAEMVDVKTFVEGMTVVGATVGSSIERTDAVAVVAAENKANIVSQKATLDGKISEVKAEVTTSLKSSTDTLQEKLDTMAIENAALKVKIAADAAAQTTTLNKMVADKTSAMDVKLAALQKLADGVGPEDLAIFVGGYQGGHRRSGWHDFTPNRVDFESSLPYFKVEGNGFKILKTGTYEMAIRVLTHGGWCHHHFATYVDDKQIQGSTHDYVPGTWQQMQTHETLTMKAGQKIRTRVYGCNYAFHGSSNGQRNSHNRIMMRYIGQVNDNCKGPFCKNW
jgi:hypothetical protein